MSEEVQREAAERPAVDFSFQLNLARDRVEKKIFGYLSQISEELFKADKRIGVLIVLGIFGTQKDSMVEGMRRLSNDKLDQYLNVSLPQFKDEIIKMFERGEDGAIIVNQEGQILSEKIYLTVDNPSVDIPEGTGTRHISAASFSTRPDILATFTLSEETLIVRTWKDGSYTDQFNPGKKDEDDE